MRPIHLICVLVIALAGAASATATTTQSSTQLLQRYAPVLVSSTRERFLPEQVDGFLADSTLVGGSYDQTACKAIGGPAALPCYVAADRKHAEPPAVYGAVFRSGGRTVLEYWLFYYFDLYSFANPLGAVWQDHEGDWEAVAVVLDVKAKPLLVGTSRHCTGARREWARVRRRGDRPVVYVALGSHANYFGPGLPGIPTRCLPPQARTLLEQYGVTLPDQVGVGRTIANAKVVLVTASLPSWMAFGGAWGEAQYVKTPNQSPVAYGTSPTGPVSHALWRQPLSTVLGWPKG